MEDEGGGSEKWTGGDFSPVEEFGARVGDREDGGNDLIDIELILKVLGEGGSNNSSQRSPENSEFKDLFQKQPFSDANNQEKRQPENGCQGFEGGLSFGVPLMDVGAFCPSYNSEPSVSRKGDSGDSSGYSGKLEQAQVCSPAHTCSGSPKDWNFPGQGTFGTQRVKASQSDIPSCSTASSFVEDSNYVSDHGDNLDIKHKHLASHGRVLFRHVGGEHDSNYASQSPAMKDSNVELGNCGGLTGDSFEHLKAPENHLPGSVGAYAMEADISPRDESNAESALCNNSDMTGDFKYPYSASEHFVNMDCTLASLPCGVPSYYPYQFFPDHEEIVTDMKGEVEGFATENACSIGGMIFSDQGGMDCGSVSEVSMIYYSDVDGQHFKCEDSHCVSPTHGYSSSNLHCGITDDQPSVHQFGYSYASITNKEQDVCLKDAVDDEVLASRGMTSGSVEVIDGAIRMPYSNANELHSFHEKAKQMVSVSQKNTFLAEEEKEGRNMTFKGVHHFGGINDHYSHSSLHFDLNGSDQSLSCAQPFTSIKRQYIDCTKEKAGGAIHPMSLNSHLSKVSPESIQSNSPNYKSPVDDDDELCILEDISQPARSNQSRVPGKSLVALYHSTHGDSVHYSGIGGTRIKPNDERFIFRAALQDISQPKAEASPPEGVLAVPLLRHQRIALSWMVQKETASLHCSGGILADDQGLGKTVSTIALILKERPPSFRAGLEDFEKGELETLNLDEDEVEFTECYGMRQDTDYSRDISNSSLTKSVKQSWQAKGRPAAGTLVVCPTSVLRQWAEELRNKVTSKANLSVLVYHGSNRTKDPCELTKYDVVLTTYSIVSNEVPKQPLVDKDDDEKGTSEVDGALPMGLSSSKKRKYPSSSDKKSSKHKKKMDGALPESLSSPLAKVAWFRVVLDEAQSIKNHRTQVARACWGLRAKRRWCLSGTPIQNAIDDLYSYFRFLRYDPYAVYKSFYSAIKFPISKSPANGYRKLQAVLRTVMLRRTKGTLLDGQPIITLPPKVVELKQVEFSVEERDFYERLEADSRAQFREYAEAGTVKQNYVNILLMLLRLRQACDHPFLVKGFDSSSFERISVEMAKKLPQEKKFSLLKCLEASLALCGICNDPPEDAVVTICGHVFCNQCICDHLSGDENQCPASNCKLRLSVSSVFSRSVLTSTLSGQSGQESSSASCVSASVDVVDPYAGGSLYDSSKIKAALEVLLSLTNTQDCTSTNGATENSSDGNSGFYENSSGFHAGELPNNIPDKRNTVMDKSLKDSDKMVGEKAIVFSQWTRMLDLLETCLKKSPIQYRRLDGTMSVAARDRAVKDFNTLPEVSVMIMSLKAASLGLNMVAASRVLLLDLWWNPTTEDQAIDRAHRIGQTRPVTVFRLTVKDTVEDRILALQRKKREMVASAFGEDDANNQQTRLTVEDLSYLFMM